MDQNLNPCCHFGISQDDEWWASLAWTQIDLLLVCVFLFTFMIARCRCCLSIALNWSWIEDLPVHRVWRTISEWTGLQILFECSGLFWQSIGRHLVAYLLVHYFKVGSQNYGFLSIIFWPGLLKRILRTSNALELFETHFIKKRLIRWQSNTIGFSWNILQVRTCYMNQVLSSVIKTSHFCLWWSEVKWNTIPYSSIENKYFLS